MVMLDKEQRELAAQRQVQRFPRKKPRRRIGLWVGILAVVALFAVGAVAVIVATGGDEPQPTLGIAGEPEALRELYDLMYPAAPDQALENEGLVEGLVRQGAIPTESLTSIDLQLELYDQTHGSAIQAEPGTLVERLVQQGAIPAETLEPYRALEIDPLQEVYTQTHSGTSWTEPESLVERLIRQGAIPAETLE